jgi:hypothetical protein
VVTGAVAVAVLAPGRRAHGQTAAPTVTAAPAPAPTPSRRELGGHLFILSPLARNPFATTDFVNGVSLGDGRAEGILYDATGGTIGSRDYSLWTLQESVEFQYAPLSWLAVRVGGAGLVFVGGSAVSALALGAATRYQPTAGLTMSTTFGERLRAGVVFDYAYSRNGDVNVVRPIADSIEQGRIVTSNIFVNHSVHVFQPGLSAALALHRSLGLVGTLLYQGQRGGDPPDGRHAIIGAGALDFDLNPLLAWPVGFLAAYRATAPIDSDARLSQSLDLGIYYTGRREFQLGLDVGGRRFEMRAGSHADAGTATLETRYFW